MIPINVKSYLYLWLVSKELFELARFCQLLLNLATREIIKHSSPEFLVTIVLNRYKIIILYNTRSIGTIGHRHLAGVPSGLLTFSLCSM